MNKPAKTTIPACEQTCGDIVEKPITLPEACQLVGDWCKVSRLRKERDAGRLRTFRVGNRDLTKPSYVQGMIEKWDSQENQPDLQSEPTKPQTEKCEHGKSETGQSVSAQDALSARLRARTGCSKITLDKPSKPNEAEVIQLPSKSQMS
jgi:hypothetical protein